MDQAVWDVYYALERDHWWNQAKRNIVLSFLERFGSLNSDSKVADIGAGTASYSEVLAKKGMTVEAHDESPFAIKQFKKLNIPYVQKKFPDDYEQICNEYDAIFLLDVLEHLEDDEAGMKIALQLLKPNGILICTVPASKKMWGEFDVIAHHYRRYSLKDFRYLFKGKNVCIEKLSYYSTLFFPLIFLVRKIENFFYYKSNRKPVFRPHFVPSFLNKILYLIFNFEKFLLAYFNFPFGSALVAVIRKI